MSEERRLKQRLYFVEMGRRWEIS